MAIIDSGIVIDPLDPSLPSGSVNSLSEVWDAEKKAHGLTTFLAESLANLETYCDDPPANPGKLSSWVNHEHESSTFLWNLKFSYSGISPNASRYYTIEMIDPKGFSFATITETYGTFTTSMTYKSKPTNGTWTFNLKERSASSIGWSQKASTTQSVFVRTGATSATTNVKFTGTN